MLGLSPISGAPISGWYVSAIEPEPTPPSQGGRDTGGWATAPYRQKTENDEAFLIAVLL